MSMEAKVTVSGGGSGGTFKVQVSLGDTIGGECEVGSDQTAYQAAHELAPFITEWLNTAIAAGQPKPKGKAPVSS